MKIEQLGMGVVPLGYCKHATAIKNSAWFSPSEFKYGTTVLVGDV